MVLPRTTGLLLLCASAAVQAQQTPPPPSGQAASDIAKAKAANRQKVSCRIHMDGNAPRKICLTNEQWTQVTGDGVDSTKQTYINRFGCTGMGEAPPGTGTQGAC
jgi:Spy/CpxP family protein refolding chaperone